MNRRNRRWQSSKPISPIQPAAVKDVLAVGLCLALAILASTGGLKAHPETESKSACHKRAPNGETFLWSLVGFDGEVYVYDWSEIAKSTPDHSGRGRRNR